MEDIKIRAFGSLYVGDKFMKPGKEMPEGVIEFMNSPLSPVRWALINGKWYCLNTYCLGISWEDLRIMGYVYGRPVTIDGKSYLCRCPQLKPGGEWDQVVKSAKGVVSWENKSTCFYGQEYFPEDSYSEDARCSIAGRYGVEIVVSGSVDEHDPNTGWRPVLEPIDGPTCDPTPALLNSPVSVFLGSYCLHGALLSYTDYDVVIQYDGHQMLTGPNKAVLIEDGKACISRSSIVFLRAE